MLPWVCSVTDNRWRHHILTSNSTDAPQHEIYLLSRGKTLSLVIEGSTCSHILAVGTYTILLKHKPFWSFQIQEDKLKKVKFGNGFAAARNYRKSYASLSHDVTMAKRSSRQFYFPGTFGGFMEFPNWDGGAGVYLKGVTFNVSVKCLYDDTNSLPTKYTVFKPTMAQ